MRKGISPVVAVVLLIAIAVIAAVGLYFWVGGLATKQPTADKPIPLNAQTYKCDLGNSSTTEHDVLTVLIQNLDSAVTLTNSSYPLKILDDDGEEMVATTAPDIIPSGQEAWVFNSSTGTTSNLTNGFTYIIYGTGVGQAVIVC